MVDIIAVTLQSQVLILAPHWTQLVLGVSCDFGRSWQANSGALDTSDIRESPGLNSMASGGFPLGRLDGVVASDTIVAVVENHRKGTQSPCVVFAVI
jgi:hypothetical protein